MLSLINTTGCPLSKKTPPPRYGSISSRQYSMFPGTIINLSPVHPIVRVPLPYSSPITLPFIFIPIFSLFLYI